MGARRDGRLPGPGRPGDTDVVIRWYSWLAEQFVLCDHHVGSRSSSTPGHTLAVGGQMPTGVTQPTPPPVRPVPPGTRPWPGPLGVPMPALVTLDGSTVPAPTDGVVRATPPKH